MSHTLKQLQEMTAQDVLRLARREIGQIWTQGTLVEKETKPGFRTWDNDQHKDVFDFSKMEVTAVCAIGSLTHVLELFHTNDGVAYPVHFKAKTKKEKRMKKLALEAQRALFEAIPEGSKARVRVEQAHKEDVYGGNVDEMMADGIINYNDADKRHPRTITKWFDRAIEKAAV